MEDILFHSMSPSDTDTSQIKDLLLWFISEQREANTEFRGSFAEQKIFNERIEKKIDKVQYFLEETIAENTEMFFEEQIELKVQVKELEDEVAVLRDNIILTTLDLRNIKLQFS